MKYVGALFTTSFLEVISERALDCTWLEAISKSFAQCMFSNGDLERRFSKQSWFGRGKEDKNPLKTVLLKDATTRMR